VKSLAVVVGCAPGRDFLLNVLKHIGKNLSYFLIPRYHFHACALRRGPGLPLGPQRVLDRRNPGHPSGAGPPRSFPGSVPCAGCPQLIPSVKVCVARSYSDVLPTAVVPIPFGIGTTAVGRTSEYQTELRRRAPSLSISPVRTFPGAPAHTPATTRPIASV